jgi:ketosteroid isomerase-like protein
MSQENVEAFKSAVEANNRGDYEALIARMHPDVEWHAVFQVMFGGQARVCRGHEGVREYLRDLDEAFDVRQVEILEFRDMGKRIVAIGQVRGRGRVSGAELDSPISFVAEFTDGKVIRMSDYLNATEALEAAGLSEEAMSQENLENSRAFFEAWNAGDMNAVRESYDPHVVLRYADGWPEGLEPILGREAVMRQWEQQREAFDADTIELIEIIDLGDRVVTRFNWRAVGSGPDVNLEMTSVSTMRKGKTILVEFFWNHAEALAAVGLSE